MQDTQDTNFQNYLITELLKTARNSVGINRYKIMLEKYNSVIEYKEHFQFYLEDSIPYLENKWQKALQADANLDGDNVVLSVDYNAVNEDSKEFCVFYYIILTLLMECIKFSAVETNGVVNQLIKVFDETTYFELENYGNSTKLIDEFVKHNIIIIDWHRANKNLYSERDRNQFKEYALYILSKRPQKGLFINFHIMSPNEKELLKEYNVYELISENSQSLTMY